MTTTKRKEDPLAGLFGDDLRPRLLRVLIYGTEGMYTNDEVAHLLGIKKQLARTELGYLVKDGLVIEKKATRGKTSRKKVKVYCLNRKYQYIDLVKDLFLNTFPVYGRDIAQGIQQVGDVCTIIVSGVFTGAHESIADIVIVGDTIDLIKLRKTLMEVEKSLGKELRYMVFDKNEFLHRMSVKDKILREIIDYPHRVLHNTLDSLPLHEESSGKFIT